MNNPFLILWNPRFTPQHPFYRLSLYPEITKTRMAKDLLGIDLPKEADGPDLVKLSDAKLGIILYLGTWDQFLQIATKTQIADVMKCLEDTSRPDD